MPPFQVLLSNPIETPKMADYGFLIIPGTENRVAIQPIMNDATDTLRDIDISKRQCYFPDERFLLFFQYVLVIYFYIPTFPL